MNYHRYLSELMVDEGMQKTAGPALDAALKAVKNAPTLGGAAAGSVYGGVKGYQGAGEGQGAGGALGGAVVGGVAGGFLGGGLRNLHKNVPKGYKDWRQGHKDLAKELKASGMKPDDAKFWSKSNLKSYVPFTEKGKRWKYVDDKGKSYKRVQEQLGAGKQGQELVKADDKALKTIGAYGDIVAGRRRMIGGAIGGGVAAGYGGYQLKSTGDTAKQTDEEKHLQNVSKNIDNYVAARRAVSNR
jgi:hypothetical protein